MSTFDEADLPGSVRHHARTRPLAPALEWRGTTTTYGKLAELMSEAAGRFTVQDLASGYFAAGSHLFTGPGAAAVGVTSEKSPAVIATVLAAVEAGHPVVMPSLQWPDDQLRDLCRRAGCRMLITDGGHLIGDGVPGPDGAGSGPGPLDDRLRSAAFVLSTSGSTGRPKLVPMGAAALGRFVGWAASTLGIGAGTTVLNYAPLNFDLCALELWATLAAGGQVVLVTADEAIKGKRIAELIAGSDAEIVQAVPLCFGLLAAAGAVLDRVRVVITTGDVLPDETRSRLPALFPSAVFYNVYGCTETNDSFIHRFDPTRCEAGPLPIGEPLPGVEHRLVPSVDGAFAGLELVVRTPFQAAGYLDPADDAGRFSPDPLGQLPGTFYRTGDLVRVDNRGRLRLIGRVDHQVKVRGIAVNTAEVERVVCDHPDVEAVVVVAVPDPVGGRRLVGSVQRRPGTGLGGVELRRHCAAHLPRAALLSALEITDDALPTTSTGKVDRPSIARYWEDRTAVPPAAVASGHHEHQHEGELP